MKREEIIEDLLFALSGDYIKEAKPLPMPFENMNIDEIGKYCSLQYENIYNAKYKIIKKYKVDEDDDILQIFDSYSNIIKFVGTQMFEYGKQYGENLENK